VWLAGPIGWLGFAHAASLNLIPTLADKKLMSSIRRLFAFILRTASILAVVWLLFLAAKIVSQRFAWGFLHQFLGPPF
jgi:hypothetical protein